MSKRVLVVEDEPLLLIAAVMLVENAGYVAIEASNAEEAIAALEKYPDISMVFTDVQMAGSIDGKALAHAVSVRWPPVRLIVVSGQVNLTSDDLPEGARFFSKPYDYGAVTKAMHAMLN